MAWEGSDRRDRLPADWPARRAAQLELDGHRCRWRLRSGVRCPRRATEVDHIEEKADRHEVGKDLQSLCAHHHGLKTTAAAARFRRQKAQKRYRKPEEHPGALS